MVFCAAQRLDPFTIFTSGLIDVLPDCCRTDETHRLHGRTGQQRIYRDFVAVNHIQNTIWQTGFTQQFGHAQRTGRITLRGLEHKCVATGNRNGKHPHRHHRRKIERRNPCTHPYRLTHAPAVYTGGNALGILSFE